MKWSYEIESYCPRRDRVIRERDKTALEGVKNMYKFWDTHRQTSVGAYVSPRIHSLLESNHIETAQLCDGMNTRCGGKAQVDGYPVFKVRRSEVW